MAFSEVRVRKGRTSNPCTECGAPGNRCFDYCTRFNDNTVSELHPPSTEDEEAGLLTPYEAPYRLENWPLDDLIAYVGGDYAKEAYSK